MTILAFVASLVGDLAWPVAAVVIGFIFRAPIKGLINRLKTLGFGGAEAAFAEGLDRVEAASDKVIADAPAPAEPATPSPPAKAAPPPISDNGPSFEEVLRVSPKLAIIHQWIDVEHAVRDLARAAEIRVKNQSNSTLVSILVQQGKIQWGLAQLIQQLRELRNKAAHAPYELSVDEAVRFHNLAHNTIEILKNATQRELA